MSKEDDLLELQTLALNRKHGCPHIPIEKRRIILDQALRKRVPITRLSKEFGVGRYSIYRWINSFAEGKFGKKTNQNHPKKVSQTPVMSRKIQKPVETESEELARLREENKRLAEALKMAEWMNHAKDVMIDEAEKTFNIPIRKKSGAKQ
jgi:transposase-like protein